MPVPPAKDDEEIVQWRPPPVAKHFASPSVLAFLLTATLYGLGATERLGYWLLDIQSQLLQRHVASKLVIVEIDAESVARFQSWPWPRGRHGELLDRLVDAGVRHVFFDIDFSARSTPSEDLRFEAALAAASPGTVFLAAFEQPADAGHLDHMLVSRPIPSLGDHASLVNVNVRPSADSLIRRMPPDPIDTEILGHSLGTLLLGPRGAAEELYLDFTIHPDSFRRYSYADVLDRRVPADALHDRVVLVGATAIELGDIVPVPVYGAMPGVMVQALAVESRRAGPLAPIPGWSLLLWCGVAALVMGRVGARYSWGCGLLALLAASTALFVVALLAYDQLRLIVDCGPLILVLALCYLFSLLSRIDQQSLKLLLQSLELREKEALMAAVVENNIDAIITLDAAGTVTHVNPAAEQLFDYPRAEFIGLAGWQLLPELITKGPDQAATIQTAESRETVGLRRSGDMIPLEISLTPLQIAGTGAYTAIIRDITEKRRQAQELDYQATHDSLTGLHNRAYFERRIQVGIDDGSFAVGALLMLDLNDFKEINDVLGHAVGDVVLREIAQRFLTVGDVHCLARIGGDEFAAYLDGGTEIERRAAELADRIVGSLSRPVRAGGIDLELGVSIGIALHPLHGNTLNDLMRQADVAMFKAKRNRCSYAFYDQGEDPFSVRRLAIGSRLRHAIEAEQFTVHFQPKLDLESGALCGAEALVRWPEPELGMVAPDEFIGLAERSELIRPLTELVLRQSLAQCAHFRTIGSAFRVAVNLSARLLQDMSCDSLIVDCLHDASAQPDWLDLEITETAIMTDPRRAMLVAKKIRDLGVRLSIDDFGTGYSSLAYLQKLPIQELKIDRSFVGDLISNSDNRAIVRSTVRLAHDLGLSVVAEGVEDLESLIALQQIGCDRAQGYWISRPLPATEFANFLEQWSSAAFRNSCCAALASRPDARVVTASAS